MCLTACLLNQNGDFAYNMVRSLCLKVSFHSMLQIHISHNIFPPQYAATNVMHSRIFFKNIYLPLVFLSSVYFCAAD